MRKKILFVMLAGVALFFSCQEKNEGSRISQPIAESESETASGMENYGFAVIIGANFFTLSAEGGNIEDEATKVVWRANMPLGERFEAGESRSLSFVNNSNQTSVLSLVEARRSNGEEGFALAAHVAVGGELAVVVDANANLFRSPQNVDVSGTVLSRRSVVVHYPESRNNSFVRVRGRDFGRNVYIDTNNNYLRDSSLSSREADVQSAILLLTAQSLPEGQNTRKDALLDAALADYRDSVFFTEIYELRSPPEDALPDVMDFEDNTEAEFAVDEDNDSDVALEQ